MVLIQGVSAVTGRQRCTEPGSVLHNPSRHVVGVGQGADSGAFGSIDIQAEPGLWLWGWRMDCAVYNVQVVFSQLPPGFLTLEVSQLCLTQSLGALS